MAGYSAVTPKFSKSSVCNSALNWLLKFSVALFPCDYLCPFFLICCLSTNLGKHLFQRTFQNHNFTNLKGLNFLGVSSLHLYYPWELRWSQQPCDILRHSNTWPSHIFCMDKDFTCKIRNDHQYLSSIFIRKNFPSITKVNADHIWSE